MLTNKIPGSALRALFWTVLSVLFVVGCGPPGPRALLNGEKLIREGKYDQAIEKLERATQLLPKSAQAWNYLGLAYHGNNQPIRAIKAYRQALTLDSRMAAVRYNLGCASLDQNDLPLAMEQLTSFTILQPNAPEGWIKLGTAQLRANKLDLAEKSLRSALELRPGSVEALNGMGLIQFQKRRFAEAFTFFNSAVVENPNYGPALLNAAVAAHQIASNRQQALQLYRRYLALKPVPEDADKILVVANQLEAELNPPRVIAQVAPPAPPPKPAAKTNVVAAITNPPITPVPPRFATHVTPASSNAVGNARSNTEIASLSPPAKIPVRTNVFALSNLPAVVVVPKPITNEPPIEVTRVDDGFIIKPPQELSGAAQSTGPRSTNVVTIAEITNSGPEATLVEKSNKVSNKSFLSRINPFTTKSKTPSSPAGNVPGAATEVTALDSNIGSAPVLANPPLTRRYTFMSPAKPIPGNQAAARKYLTEGARAQQAGLLSQAAANYKRALENDPASFDAYYNLTLAALDVGNWDEALRTAEYALAINPEALNARYSFGLALKQARYPQDAAEQFERILRVTPNDARVHLKLANVYAEQLRQPQLARVHYEKVLELEPAHPQAVAIRSWLARNASG